MAADGAPRLIDTDDSHVWGQVNPEVGLPQFDSTFSCSGQVGEGYAHS